MFSRRSLLAASGVAAISACSAESGRREDSTLPDLPGATRHDYGDAPSQFFELHRPVGASRGVVVVVHGGFWKEQYDLSLGDPLAESLAGVGWTAINLEYRRVGGGGGWPSTFDDVAAGVDALAEIEDLDTSTVITLGHSAGGHLAVWAAGRERLDNTHWNSPKVRVTAAVSQAGVLDLGGAVEESLGGGATEALVGGTPDDVPERYADADPMRRVPLDVPVRCIHGVDDALVPISQSSGYVAAATSGGADAAVTEVAGDHFVVIDRDSPAWETTLKILDDLASTQP